MAFSFKLGLLAATAGVAMLAGTAASAQTTTAPTPPSGGFYMANGTRTTNYQTALASWRTDAQFSVDYSKGFLGLETRLRHGLVGAGTDGPGSMTPASMSITRCSDRPAK